MPAVAQVRSVVNRWVDATESRKDFEISHTNATAIATDVAAAANTTFRKVMKTEDEKKLDYSEVDIDTPSLLKLLQDTMKHMAPGIFEARPVNIRAPFRAFVWNWDHLTQATDPLQTDDTERRDAREMLKKLLEYIKGAPEVEGYFKSRDSHFANKSIEFKYLWTLFGPGTQIYAQSFQKDMQMFEVQIPHYEKDGECSVWCAAYDWDGDRFVRFTYLYIIKRYEGPRLIKILPCYPVQYFEASPGIYDDRKLRKSLIERGRRFCQLCTLKSDSFQCEYDGLVMVKTVGASRFYMSDVLGTCL